eukprot:403352209
MKKKSETENQEDKIDKKIKHRIAQKQDLQGQNILRSNNVQETTQRGKSIEQELKEEPATQNINSNNFDTYQAQQKPKFTNLVAQSKQTQLHKDSHQNQQNESLSVIQKKKFIDQQPFHSRQNNIAKSSQRLANKQNQDQFDIFSDQAQNLYFRNKSNSSKQSRSFKQSRNKSTRLNQQNSTQKDIQQSSPTSNLKKQHQQQVNQELSSQNTRQNFQQTQQMIYKQKQMKIRNHTIISNKQYDSQNQTFNQIEIVGSLQNNKSSKNVIEQVAEQRKKLKNIISMNYHANYGNLGKISPAKISGALKTFGNGFNINREELINSFKPQEESNQQSNFLKSQTQNYEKPAEVTRFKQLIDSQQTPHSISRRNNFNELSSSIIKEEEYYLTSDNDQAASKKKLSHILTHQTYLTNSKSKPKIPNHSMRKKQKQLSISKYDQSHLKLPQIEQNTIDYKDSTILTHKSQKATPKNLFQKHQQQLNNTTTQKMFGNQSRNSLGINNNHPPLQPNQSLQFSIIVQHKDTFDHTIISNQQQSNQDMQCQLEEKLFKFDKKLGKRIKKLEISLKRGFINIPLQSQRGDQSTINLRKSLLQGSFQDIRQNEISKAALNGNFKGTIDFEIEDIESLQKHIERNKLKILQEREEFERQLQISNMNYDLNNDLNINYSNVKHHEDLKPRTELRQLKKKASTSKIPSTTQISMYKTSNIFLNNNQIQNKLLNAKNTPESTSKISKKQQFKMPQINSQNRALSLTLMNFRSQNDQQVKHKLSSDYNHNDNFDQWNDYSIDDPRNIQEDEFLLSQMQQVEDFVSITPKLTNNSNKKHMLLQE